MESMDFFLADNRMICDLIDTQKKAEAYYFNEGDNKVTFIISGSDLDERCNRRWIIFDFMRIGNIWKLMRTNTTHQKPDFAGYMADSTDCEKRTYDYRSRHDVESATHEAGGVTVDGEDMFPDVPECELTF